MSNLPPSTPHLVERAAQAMSRAAGLRPAVEPVATPEQPRIPRLRPAVELAEPVQVMPAAIPAVPAVPPISAQILARAGLQIVAGAGRSRQSEEVAIVFNQILGAIRGGAGKPGPDRRLVMITSAQPGEGKSFSALNIAGGIAISGRQPVVLIDADGKRGSTSELLGLGKAKGLRDLAARPGEAAAGLILPTEHERLSFLPYGETDLAPIPSATIGAALSRLAPALPGQVIIIDAPPCLATSEAHMLAPAVGQIVMIVEAERTQRSEVEAALDMIEACETIYLVLNQARFTGRGAFGSYGYETYGNAPDQA